MRRSRVSIAEKRATESMTKYNSSQRKMTSVGPRITKKNFSVSMVNTRSTKENKTKEGAEGKQANPANEIDLETPDQSVDEVEKKTTESTPMPNAERTEAKVDGILTDRHCGGHDGQPARNNKGRVSIEKNVIYRKDSNDGRDEIERHS